MMVRVCREIWRYDHSNHVWLHSAVKWFDGRVINRLGKPKARSADRGERE